ncbi:hypothetical protein ACERII_19965 [Evansella sp. AB-rgal1]|uniref:hypothetical protein n=1 Tax=Evansella sp. AB-rgal1 TaxID=3242696 RepID=UPI00359D6736
MRKIEYDKLSEAELVTYYERIRGYMEKGFRVDGLKEELELLFLALSKRSDQRIEKKQAYLQEITYYLKTLRL